MKTYTVTIVMDADATTYSETVRAESKSRAVSSANCVFFRDGLSGFEVVSIVERDCRTN